MVQAILGTIILLVMFIGVLILSYIVTKKLGDFKQGGVRRKNLQIVEVLPLAGGQYLYIVKVGMEYHLFSGTKDSLRHCFKLEEEKLDLAGAEKTPFDDYLKKFVKAKEGEMK
ncbi:MAG: flagellar biosynthetic protein FliO [Cellulosilyticaceae bacterium]